MNIIYIKKRRKLGYGFPALDASGDNFQAFTDAITKYTNDNSSQSNTNTAYAGGEFTSMQGLANTRGIAAYDPSTDTWQDVGGGLGNGEVNAMGWDSENEILYIAGNFTSVGGQTIRYLAQWERNNYE